MHTCSGRSLNGRSRAGAAHLEAICLMCTSPTEKSAKREAEADSLLTMSRFSAVCEAEYSRYIVATTAAAAEGGSNALRGVREKEGRTSRSDRATSAVSR